MFGFLKKPASDESVVEIGAAPTWRERLKAGLSRTRAQFGGELKTLFARGRVDDELLEELETLLLTSDIGMTTTHLLEELKRRTKAKNWKHRKPSRRRWPARCTNCCTRWKNRSTPAGTTRTSS